MTRHVSTAEAKARLSELIGTVTSGRERVVIERRGRPVAALVSIDDAEALEETRPTTSSSRGAPALVGAWSEVGDEVIDRLVDEIYAARDMHTGRPVGPLE